MTRKLYQPLAILFFSLAVFIPNSHNRASVAEKNTTLQENKAKQEVSKKNRYRMFARQKVTVTDFAASVLILDIGGGGEGVIGQIKKEQCIAIDISKRELVDAPPGPLKIVMDARELQFVDGSFNTATIFFTLMYIGRSDHEKVFAEVNRVLRPGGKLLIWDVMLAERIDEAKDRALFPMSIQIPEKLINTGYGVRWPAEAQDLDHYISLGRAAGFIVEKKEVSQDWFYLELKKKN